MKRAWSIWHGLIVAGTFLVTLHWYGLLPERIPVHWNLKGQIDGYGPKPFIFGIPVLMLVIQAILGAVARTFEAKKGNRNAQETRRAMTSMASITTGTLVFLAFIQGVIITTAIGKNLDVPRLASVSVSLLVMFLGGQMPGLPRNHWVGIRTPWTLMSDHVWNETHRRAAPVMRWAGFAGAALTLTPWPWTGVIVSVCGVIYPAFDSWRISGAAPR